MLFNRGGSLLIHNNHDNNNNNNNPGSFTDNVHLASVWSVIHDGWDLEQKLAPIDIIFFFIIIFFCGLLYSTDA